MCFSKLISGYHNSSAEHMDEVARGVRRINGRPVLQPTCNHVPPLERRNSLKKASPAAARKATRPSPSPPISPKTPSPKQPSTRGLKNSPPPGSITTATREQLANMQEQRKIKIAHYGRTTTTSWANKQVVPVHSLIALLDATREDKRCTFITQNSDPIYVAYHDDEWGVPVYDDRMLFELLVLTTAQVGSDWTAVLKKRLLLRDAFAGFDAQVVAGFRERKIASISLDYDIELCQVRGAVDNANQILKIKREFLSLSNYLWRFVKNKPMCSNYKTWQKVPVKTSKSEGISKDLVKRGFRFVGPAVIHSFMQAAGLTNDHLLTCPSRLLCSQLQTQQPTNQ